MSPLTRGAYGATAFPHKAQGLLCPAREGLQPHPVWERELGPRLFPSSPSHARAASAEQRGGREDCFRPWWYQSSLEGKEQWEKELWLEMILKVKNKKESSKPKVIFNNRKYLKICEMGWNIVNGAAILTERWGVSRGGEVTGKSGTVSCLSRVNWDASLCWFHAPGTAENHKAFCRCDPGRLADSITSWGFLPAPAQSGWESDSCLRNRANDTKGYSEIVEIANVNHMGSSSPTTYHQSCAVQYFGLPSCAVVPHATILSTWEDCKLHENKDHVFYFIYIQKIQSRLFTVLHCSMPLHMLFIYFFYSYFIYLFIYFWLCWVFGSCEGFL